MYAAYGHVGEQVRVPITGHRAKRILHGALNGARGDVVPLVTQEWVQESHPLFVERVRSHGRGWHVVLFEERAGQHTAPASLALAGRLGIEVRLLPRATPELNAMDGLWRHAKRATQGNRPPQRIEECAAAACWYILNLSPRERRQQAGVLSGNFWWTK